MSSNMRARPATKASSAFESIIVKINSLLLVILDRTGRLETGVGGRERLIGLAETDYLLWLKLLFESFLCLIFRKSEANSLS
jgi:hypothetical protein